MRLDKWLKNSRLIKRRTVAKDACDGDKIFLNGKLAKPGTDVKVGDIVEIVFGEKRIRAEILDMADKATREAAREMYKLLD